MGRAKDLGDRLWEVSDRTYGGGGLLLEHGRRLERCFRDGEHIVAAAKCWRLFGEAIEGGLVMSDRRLLALPEKHHLTPTRALVAMITGSGDLFEMELDDVERIEAAERSTKPKFMERMRANWVSQHNLLVHTTSGDLVQHESIMEGEIRDLFVSGFAART